MIAYELTRARMEELGALMDAAHNRESWEELHRLERLEAAAANVRNRLAAAKSRLIATGA